MTKSTRFNFVSETADGFGFAYRLAQEGSPVRMWTRSSSAKSVGDNMIDKVGDVEDLIADARETNDVFIFDVSGNGVLADYLRRTGYPVLGGSMIADMLERDREYGANVMRQCGIEVPPTFSFDDFDTAINFVIEHNDVRWVYKPSKQLGDLSPSHVSYDTDDMIELLKNVQNEVSIADPQFELQLFIEDGIAFSTELWFNDGQLVDALTNHTLERKELMNDNIGPSGGCTGNVVWFCDGCPVCEVAKKLVKFCRDQSYHGMLDLNVIVSEDDIYGLEFTPRFGYDASPTLLWSCLNGELGKFLSDMARGQVSRFDQNAGFGGGVRITMPPWPTEKYHADENVPIRGLGKAWDKKTFLYNVKENESGLCSAGAWGILMLFTGYGKNIVDSLEEPYKMADRVRVSNKQYRTDLAESFNKDFRKLRSLLKAEVE